MLRPLPGRILRKPEGPTPRRGGQTGRKGGSPRARARPLVTKAWVPCLRDDGCHIGSWPLAHGSQRKNGIVLVQYIARLSHPG